MSIIKKPATPSEIITLEMQIERPLIEMLDRYADFIGRTRNLILTSVVRLVFKKDYDFKPWLREQLARRKREEIRKPRTRLQARR